MRISRNSHFEEAIRNVFGEGCLINGKKIPICKSNCTNMLYQTFLGLKETKKFYLGVKDLFYCQFGKIVLIFSEHESFGIVCSLNTELKLRIAELRAEWVLTKNEYRR